jgi:hypothetical protein
VHCKETYKKKGRKRQNQRLINERKRNPENQKTEKRQGKLIKELRKK